MTKSQPLVSNHGKSGYQDTRRSGQAAGQQRQRGVLDRIKNLQRPNTEGLLNRHVQTAQESSNLAWEPIRQGLYLLMICMDGIRHILLGSFQGSHVKLLVQLTEVPFHHPRLLALHTYNLPRLGG